MKFGSLHSYLRKNEATLIANIEVLLHMCIQVSQPLPRPRFCPALPDRDAVLSRSSAGIVSVAPAYSDELCGSVHLPLPYHEPQTPPPAPSMAVSPAQSTRICNDN